jgi:hypothetical protein
MAKQMNRLNKRIETPFENHGPLLSNRVSQQRKAQRGLRPQPNYPIRVPLALPVPNGSATLAEPVAHK